MNYRKAFKFFFRPLIGNVRFQEFYELLYELSLKGMNIGMGRAFQNSGEKYVVDYIADNFSKSIEPIVFFDAGANIGQHANYILHKYGDKFIAYSFEPLPAAIEVIKNNLGNFRNSKAVNIAVGEEDGKVFLLTRSATSVHATLHSVDSYKKQGNHTQMEVVIRSLDSYCNEHRIPKIHFLKIDVEGHEMPIIKGAQNLIDNDLIYAIQFEFGGEINRQLRIFFKDFYDVLAERFKIYRVLQNGLYFIKQCDVRHEQYFCTNFLAIVKNIKHFS